MKYLLIILLATTACARPKGETGLSGLPGAPGTPGTAITLVQLCPGISTYPNKFIEYAECIDGQLYGVYSQNGGFLTLLPPGVYTSDGINSSCSFTVLLNCGILH